ncbi:MAG TPA: hypothetical protein VFV94_17275 [Polyangiaceae bacterium]|nr:hypothetical protein [Polyangiaceae bacterium]
MKVVGKDGRQRRVQRVAPIQNRRAAEKLEHELREELLNADDRNAKAALEAPIFSEFAEDFIKTYATANNKPSELESKRMILRVHLVPALGHLRLDEVGIAEIDAYKAKKLAAKLAPKTVNNHLTVLRKLLTTAVAWERLTVAPPIKWMKPPSPEFDFLTFEEADRLIAAAESEWQAMITVAVRTGLRLGELLAAHLSPDARRDAVRLLDVKEPITLCWKTSSGRVIQVGGASTWSAAA